MSRDRLPPPNHEACLVRLRPSSQKGGTIIAEDVTDRAAHERRICDPDGYRPAFCPSCGDTTLHVHDDRQRVLRAEPGEPVARVVRHECVGCAAIWQILPAFIARCLWRTWRVVEHTLTGAGPPLATREPRRWPPVPARTQRRWLARWQRPARRLAQVLAACGAATWAALATIRQRVRRLLVRRGREPGDEATGPADRLAEESPVLAGIVGASVQGRVALGHRAGARVRRLGDAPDTEGVMSRGPLGRRISRASICTPTCPGRPFHPR